MLAPPPGPTFWVVQRRQVNPQTSTTMTNLHDNAEAVLLRYVIPTPKSYLHCAIAPIQSEAVLRILLRCANQITLMRWMTSPVFNHMS